MAAQDAQDAIESFLNLEERLTAFCKIVPFAPAHYRVHSPTLASMLLDCGSLSESIFKSAMDNAHYDARQGVNAIRARRYTATPPLATRALSFVPISSTIRAFGTFREATPQCHGMLGSDRPEIPLGGKPTIQ